VQRREIRKGWADEVIADDHARSEIQFLNKTLDITINLQGVDTLQSHAFAQNILE
jgi:hypothetical protein